MRRVAVLGGGDWFDASVDLVEIPDNTSLDGAQLVYRTWLREIYAPALKAGDRIKFLNFVDFLKQNYGAVDATDIETFYETDF